MIKKLPNVKVVEEENVPETIAVQKSMEAMIEQDGATLIFATSFGYFDPHVLKMAAKYPNVRFAHCGGLWKQGNPSNITSYFGYIDECQYLNGVVAGHMSKSKKLGFVAAKPIPQVLRNINCVHARRAVGRSFDHHARDFHRRLVDAGQGSGSDQQPRRSGLRCADLSRRRPEGRDRNRREARRMSCGYHASQAALAPKGYLTGAEWDWATPYKQLVAGAQAGKPQPNVLRGGLKEGFVKMSPYGAKVTPDAKQNADAIEGKHDGRRLRDLQRTDEGQQGRRWRSRPARITSQTDYTLESMNYLVAGVVGQI